jgi:hypothetical protein
MNGDVITDDRLIVEVERFSWGILLFLLVMSLFFLSTRVTMGILTGGLICIFNFRWLKVFTGRLLSCVDVHRAKAMARFNYFFRYLAVAVIIYAVFKAKLVYEPATFLGLSVVFLAITTVGIKRAVTEAKRRRN